MKQKGSQGALFFFGHDNKGSPLAFTAIVSGVRFDGGSWYISVSAHLSWVSHGRFRRLEFHHENSWGPVRVVKVLVTGASGYVGGRLVPALLAEGHEIRCLARTPAKLDKAPWRDGVEVVQGAIEGDLRQAMEGQEIAVYLVHSIGVGLDWEAVERTDAINFATAARNAGVRRIVYLGGLGSDEDALSAHLESRHDVGRLLASTGIPVVEVRAGVIIGSGSASFEMLRYLVDVLPVMVTPRWVATKCQPIGIADCIKVLVFMVNDSTVEPGVYELGGRDVLSYAEMMSTYAEVAGLPRRRLLAVPFVSPNLSSHWVGLVTPVPVPLARELVRSLVNEVVVTGCSATEVSGVEPIALKVAFERALTAIANDNVPTEFFDADSNYYRSIETDPEWSGGTMLRDIRTAKTSASPEILYDVVSGIGGAQGWYAGEFLWKIRGILDQLWGGPGMRRGRRAKLAIGDALDFWRVEDLRAGQRVRLHAEMRLPGDAWLTWEITNDEHATHIVQRAEFRPRGLLGRLYWYSVAPFHRWVFPGMLGGIVAHAERRSLMAKSI